MRDTPDNMADLPMADHCAGVYGKKAASDADIKRGFSIVSRRNDDEFRFGMIEGPLGSVDNEAESFKPGVVGRPEGWER